jgi:serine/threonine protein kinase
LIPQAGGVVYKAEDTKLERIVAIKFLPRHIAANAEERERFKIEAKAAAALNHPTDAVPTSRRFMPLKKSMRRYSL